MRRLGRVSRIGRFAERATHTTLARWGLGSVADKVIGKSVDRVREKLDRMSAILQDEELLQPEGGVGAPSEALLLEVAEGHRRAGVDMLRVIGMADSYQAMVRAVIDGLERCRQGEEAEGIETRIAGLDDPLARVCIRVFLLERDYILGILQYLKDEGIDHLDGQTLVARAPDILNEMRFQQSDLIRTFIEAEPGVVAQCLNALLRLKHAGEKEEREE